jgi:hypothetical protein
MQRFSPSQSCGELSRSKESRRNARKAVGKNRKNKKKNVFA